VSSRFRVRVAKDYLVFASGHFAVFTETARESLHGHNYMLAVSVEGPLDTFGFVLDFSVLKKMARRIVDSIDHKVLLAARCPGLAYRQEGDRTHIAWNGKEIYSLPTSEVIMLPVANTTVELMAEYLSGRFQAEFAEAGYHSLTSLELELDENNGQTVFYKTDLAFD
jgi:6-pyruvoyltetrahydropterin/6-carboxytetrahydropterin synthase